jgi:2-polyprenyl-3-methyl-5-hydroxy-6-metoxy-1,4-benzoquinol methylase/methyltransferase-like protein
LNEGSNQILAQRYDAVAYASRSNALTHPGHLATVATLFGLAPPAVATCRMLDVGCSDGANLLPMAAALPEAQFVGCDLSGQAIEIARASAAELGLRNVTFLQQDLASLPASLGTFDYITAHGFYSWVPPEARESLLALASTRLAGSGIMFVSYNTYPGCHMRAAAWEVLQYHVKGLADPRDKLTAARTLAALLAEPGAVQTETDQVLRDEFRKLATQPDSALFHDDLAEINQPFYFHEFAAALHRHQLTFLAEAKLSMMTAAGLSPRVQQYVMNMDRLTREQYLDFAKVRRFRQSLVCRADAPVAATDTAARVRALHVAASMALVRSAAEGKAFAGAPATDDPSVHATRAILQFLVSVAPRIVPVDEVRAQVREHPVAGARPVEALLAEACYAGTVDAYVHPPELAATAPARPLAPAIVRWQAARGGGITNLRHETLQLDDRDAMRLLTLLDGTRTHDDLAQALATGPGGADTDGSARITAYLAHFAMHGLLTRQAA